VSIQFQSSPGTNGLNEAFYAGVFTQMLKALQVVHGLNVIHMDIKPDNFLFTKGLTLKLCDFGLGQRLSSSGSKITGTSGTPIYMSPEMLRNSGCNSKTDMWSFGVTAYVLLYGTFPYMSEKYCRDAVMEVIRLGYPSPLFHPCQACERINVSDSAGKFLRLVLRREPGRRLSAKQALEHPWLAMARTEPESLLPSLKLMLTSARDVGAFGSRKTMNFTTPDKLDGFLQMQQDIHQGQRSEAVKSSRASNSLSATGVVPQHQIRVPGTIAASTLSNFDALDLQNIPGTEVSGASRSSTKTDITI